MPVPSPRLRQAVLAAADLDQVATELRSHLGLAEPFADPGVEYFGLRNAVFALGDTFLEVVSPIRSGTAAGRWLERQGGDCGYMLMFQVDDLDAARARAGEQGVREVFEVSLDDMREVHLHPADMRGAIMSLSEPTPAESWRWAGPGWRERSASPRVAGARVTVADPGELSARWQAVLGSGLEEVGICVSADRRDRGVTEIVVQGMDSQAVEIGGVRFVPDNEEEGAQP